MKIDKKVAIAIVREESIRADSGSLNASWVAKVEQLSRLCEDGVSTTHIAFLATAMLAKAVDARVDLYAIKPKLSPSNPNAYSARSLCHGVLVPLAAELGFNLGVTGREPLNNQPYFRMTQLGDDTPVHQGARPAFDYMMQLVNELNQSKSEANARDAICAFISVRRKYQPRYIDYAGNTRLTPDRLLNAISSFVRENSEGGKRAQAVVAGLMDVFAGPDRVESGRINDPSRHYPGDVCIRSSQDPNVWEKAIEVRDKPVSTQDVQIFAKKCVDMAVKEATLVMVSDNQVPIDTIDMTLWANGFGIGLTLFHGWFNFVDQALFWSAQPKPVAANYAAAFIYQRLVSVEASPATVSLWQSLVE